MGLTVKKIVSRIVKTIHCQGIVTLTLCKLPFLKQHISNTLSRTVPHAPFI